MADGDNLDFPIFHTVLAQPQIDARGCLEPRPGAPTAPVARGMEDDLAKEGEDGEASSARWFPARALAAAAVVLLFLAAAAGGDAPPRANAPTWLGAPALPHALCAPGAHTVLDGQQLWRKLYVAPVVLRDTARCDSEATTGVGGSRRWLRLPNDGALPTQPMCAVNGAAGTGGCAWLSGWEPGTVSSLPANFNAPGSYPGDGPQDPDGIAAQQVVCLERERREMSQRQRAREWRPCGSASCGRPGRWPIPAWALSDGSQAF